MQRFPPRWVLKLLPGTLHGVEGRLGGGLGGSLRSRIRQCPSVITHHRLTARLARHRQSLNYLTDVSLAPAADPVAERQWGAQEHAATQGDGGWMGRWGEGWVPNILMLCQRHVSECRHTATHYTAVV